MFRTSERRAGLVLFAFIFCLLMVLFYDPAVGLLVSLFYVFRVIGVVGAMVVVFSALYRWVENGE